MSEKNRTGGGAPKVPPSKPKPTSSRSPKPKRKAKPKMPPEDDVVSRSSRVRSTGRGGRGR